MARILVTNDDGIDSPGLHAVVAAISDLGDVVVIAPDRNRSGVSRSITLGQTLTVTEEVVPGASVALATSGTPTDCVRLAALGLAGGAPDLVVSGANQGLNVGDDVTYSGTVAAAMEAVMNDTPAIAISQQSVHLELGYPRATHFDYTSMQRFLRALVRHALADLDALPHGLVLNVNVPGLEPEEIAGVEVTNLGRRIYRDKLELHGEEDGRRRYTLYGDDPSHHDEVGTDIAAIGRGCVSITALRFDLVDEESGKLVSGWALDGFLDETAGEPFDSPGGGAA